MRSRTSGLRARFDRSKIVEAAALAAAADIHRAAQVTVEGVFARLPRFPRSQRIVGELVLRVAGHAVERDLFRKAIE